MTGISHVTPRHRDTDEYRFAIQHHDGRFVRGAYRRLRQVYGMSAFDARTLVVDLLRAGHFSDLPYVTDPLRGRPRPLPTPTGAPVDLPAPERAA